MLIISSYTTVEDSVFIDFYQTIKLKLPHDLLKKIEGYKFPIDQQRSLIGQLIVRQFYAPLLHKRWTEILFEENEHEKPLLKGIDRHYFNISHSGNQVVVAFSQENIGVDVEKAKGDRRKIAERFFTAEEIKDLSKAGTPEKQKAYFYQLWTLKESYMKAIGDGMSMSLSRFAFKKAGNEFKLAYSAYDADWRFLTPRWADDYFLSVCTKSSELPQYRKLTLSDIKQNFR